MNQILKSNIDQSVNFVEQQLIGFLESRYVRRADSYFVCYLSSQTGCNRGCRFCHLTATRQTSFEDSDYQDYLNQALQVFRHYRREKKLAEYMHYSFMARGEALANKHLVRNADEILLALAALAVKEGLPPKFNLSTILPLTLEKELTDIFQIVTPTIYYSLYSVNPDFRKKWMPGAMPVTEAFDILKNYQSRTKKIIKIHHAFIEGENDSIADLAAICSELDKRHLLCEFNLVRYNPFSEEQGKESSEAVLQRNLEYLSSNVRGTVKMVSRVGFDVKASCGMFINS